jgi:tRNA(fMet)-specific endonuclease VapC
MLQYLFDTDHLTLYERGYPAVSHRLAAQPPKTVGISAITVMEALRGRLARLNRVMDGPTRILRYGELLTVVQMFLEFPLVPYDAAAENYFQPWRGLRLGTMDLQIAAVALANKLTLVTRNRRDFARIPGLTLEDWSV